ncbi:hypothetical protein KCU81_g858, partial [Aureobasidium melanogenum]
MYFFAIFLHSVIDSLLPLAAMKESCGNSLAASPMIQKSINRALASRLIATISAFCNWKYLSGRGEDMFLAVTERLGEDPLDTLASSGKTFEVPGAPHRLERMERTEVVRGCIFECGTREVRRRIDLELDVRMARCTFGLDFTGYVSAFWFYRYRGCGSACRQASQPFVDKTKLMPWWDESRRPLIQVQQLQLAMHLHLHHRSSLNAGISLVTRNRP